MKSQIWMVLTLLVMLALAACAPQDIDTPVVPATQPPVSETPTTETPVDAVATPTLAPINLAGPPMEVGSLYEYVDGSVLVAVPGGEFIMGHGLEDSPVHTVTLSDFWIYRTEVTNDQYARCVAMGKCTPPNLESNPGYSDPAQGNNPVVGVNYEQAAAYCDFVHGRLPTEAEWEKTARGPNGNIYPWGDAAPSCDLLNFSYCLGKTAEVDEYPEGQSYYHAMSMAGNVFEWVSDWYKATYYGEAPVQDPLGPETGSRRSVRSSGFASDGYLVEVARRFSANPIDQRNDLGFRCVVEDPTWFAPYCQQLGVYGQGPNGEQIEDWNPQVDCPAVNVSQGQYCDGKTPLTTVSFSGPANAVIDSGGCVPVSGEPNKYTCASSVTVSICADCTLKNIGQVSCSKNYKYDSATGTCVWDGSGTPGRQCLPGYTYDPAQQCCSAQSGGGNVTVKQCPVGTTYVPQLDACLNYPGAGLICQASVVNLKSCEKTGDGDDGGDDGGSPCPPGQTLYCPTTYSGPCYCK